MYVVVVKSATPFEWGGVIQLGIELGASIVERVCKGRAKEDFHFLLSAQLHTTTHNSVRRRSKEQSCRASKISTKGGDRQWQRQQLLGAAWDKECCSLVLEGTILYSTFRLVAVTV